MSAKGVFSRIAILALLVFSVPAMIPGVALTSSLVSAPRLETKAGWPVNVWGNSPHPAANIPANPNFWPTNGWYANDPPACNPFVETASASCNALVLQAINNAHAVEGLPPITLPSDYSTLPYDVQAFSITNLERIDRGLPPAVGITASYDAHAVTATQFHGDVLNYSSTSYYASDWAGGYSSALEADYAYMYQDGWGGSKSATTNFDCTSATSSGCWGHLEFEMWNAGVPLAFGAAIGPWGATKYYGYNSAIVMGTTAPSSPSAYTYTWAQYVNSQSPANQCSPSIATAVGAAPDPSGGGWITSSNGSVSTTGGAPCYGSLTRQTLNAPIVGIAATPDGKGYWLVASDGGVFAFGDATFYGSMGGEPLNKPIVGMASTPDGKGYWLVASDGGIFTFGDATFYGSMGGKPLNQPIVGMASDPATGGYWLVASDGGIFSFDAPFFGSMGGKYLAKPIVGMDALGNGQGYRFVASDGGVFDFGAAGFLGSMGGQSLSAPVVGMAAAPDGNGYWLVGGSGAVYSY